MPLQLAKRRVLKLETDITRLFKQIPANAPDRDERCENIYRDPGEQIPERLAAIIDELQGNPYMSNVWLKNLVPSSYRDANCYTVNKIIEQLHLMGTLLPNDIPKAPPPY
jgi:hypothetical protein